MLTTGIELERYGLWIDGAVRDSRAGASFVRNSPYDHEPAAEYANATEEDARDAVSVARRAFDDGPWPTAPARQRYLVLKRASGLLEENADLVAERIAVESGKPISLAYGEIDMAMKAIDYYAGAVLSDEGSAISSRNPDSLGLILREPVGVAAMITAWNFPLAAVVAKVAPALAAGCTAVIKPSHFCASPTILLAQFLHEAGLPDGAFNVLTSDIDRGALVGQHLAASDAVDKIAFTGSTAAGRAVMRAAASNTKGLSLELGGKSANIVFDDAPFEAAARTAIGAFCYNAGQQCSAGSRLLVQRGIHDEFIQAVTGYAREQVLGDPRDRTTTMGPLVSPEQLSRVLNYIDIGRADSEPVTGGGKPAGDTDSASQFIEPTIFDHVDNRSRLAQEEVFGPVLAVIPFDTEAEAIELANASDYGLAGGVWSKSIDTAIRVVKGVRTGKMFVNAYNTAGLDDMPHGGYKNSGIGREFGDVGLTEYQELKTVQIKLW